MKEVTEEAMNILFFLTPKAEVAYLDESFTLRQALEKMEANGYTAIPLLSRDGKYVGTITEGDLLWYIKSNAHLTLFDAEDVSIKRVKRRRDNQAVTITSDIDSLWDKAMNQNFVPVTDDDGVFIGIVTRRDIMRQIMKEQKEKADGIYKEQFIAV